MHSTHSNRTPRSIGRRWPLLSRAGGVSEPSMEPLEQRLVMATTYGFAVYYPEGYASNTINEFVPVTNPNATPVEVRLSVRYEFGTRDQIVGTQTIPAFSRGGFTLSDAGNPAATVVRKDVPYSIIVESTQRVSANFSHYDFGTAVGESFTDTISTSWSFADGLKDAALSRDFILVFNPSDNTVSATLYLYDQNGQTTTNTISIGAQRRAGWSVQDIAAQPVGIFGARVTATSGVVVAQTHYELQSSRGWGQLGTPDGGTRAGVLPSLGYDDSFYDTNGEGPNPGPRYQADSFVSFLNTSPTDATIRLKFVYESVSLGFYQTQIVVPANTVRQLSMRDLGFVSGDQFGLLYTSNGVVTANASVYQGADATGTAAMTLANDTWDFGEGYMSQARGGSSVIENIFMFNPDSVVNNIFIDIFFFDGTTVMITDSIGPGELVSAKLQEYAVVRNHAPDSWYGLRVTSDRPIVALMEHWDSGNGGGFSTFGLASGFSRNLETYGLTN
jgi:hypothetical protein